MSKDKLTSPQQRSLSKSSKIETTKKVNRSYENQAKRETSQAEIRKSDEAMRKRRAEYHKKW